MLSNPEVVSDAQAAEKPVLSVRNLHTWFEIRRFGLLKAGEVKALDGVDFDLYPGEAISIVGESGCGKSTLAKTILGLHAPTQGEIHFEGRQVSSFTKEDRKAYTAKVGYVQQDPYGAMASFMTAQRILEEPMIIHGIKDPEERMARIRRVLEEVKLTPVEDILPKYPHQLSGGQQQRLVIARAMILEPRLLVADEPVSMLDASVRVEILQLLRNLQEAHNLAIIYITHDLSTVRYFSERIFVMYGAKIVEQSETKRLLENPEHPYTKALLEATSDPDAENLKSFKKVPSGEPPSLLNPPPGCRFLSRCEFAIQGLCEKAMPPDFETEQGKLVRCWLYDKERKQ